MKFLYEYSLEKVSCLATENASGYARLLFFATDFSCYNTDLHGFVVGTGVFPPVFHAHV